MARRMLPCLSLRGRYASTWVTLQQLYRFVPAGGYVVADDFNLAPSRRAVLEFREIVGLTCTAGVVVLLPLTECLIEAVCVFFSLVGLLLVYSALCPTQIESCYNWQASVLGR